jgi:hypothetical protein
MLKEPRSFANIQALWLEACAEEGLPTTPLTENCFEPDDPIFYEDDDDEVRDSLAFTALLVQDMQENSPIDVALWAIEHEGSCIQLRMQSGEGCEEGHRAMVEKLTSEAKQRLSGKRLKTVLENLKRLK